jgi:probable rRNA maturation factor
MLEVEFVGAELIGGEPTLGRLRSVCVAAAAAAGIDEGHVAIEFVDEARIAQLNAVHRGRVGPTDVLSFPIDGIEPLAALGQRELGDVVICPGRTANLREAVVHGVLHLAGMDHETDAGEMLALQNELLRREDA